MFVPEVAFCVVVIFQPDVFLNVTDVSDVQPLKTFVSILVIEAGIVIDLSEVQSMNIK